MRISSSEHKWTYKKSYDSYSDAIFTILKVIKYSFEGNYVRPSGSHHKENIVIQNQRISEQNFPK